MELVTLAHCFNPAEAQLIASRLRAAEFDAIVTHEGSALSMDGYALAAGGIRVQVPADQEADARALLDAPAEPTAANADLGDEPAPLGTDDFDRKQDANE